MKIKFDKLILPHEPAPVQLDPMPFVAEHHFHLVPDL